MPTPCGRSTRGVADLTMPFPSYATFYHINCGGHCLSSVLRVIGLASPEWAQSPLLAPVIDALYRANEERRKRGECEPFTRVRGSSGAY